VSFSLLQKYLEISHVGRMLLESYFVCLLHACWLLDAVFMWQLFDNLIVIKISIRARLKKHLGKHLIKLSVVAWHRVAVNTVNRKPVFLVFVIKSIGVVNTIPVTELCSW
jgi:hypothetical protein